jgi:molybdate transport system substrate-binding protein
MRRIRTVAVVVPGLLVVSLGLAACGGGSGPDESGSGGSITVLAAASLQETFTELAALFEAANAGSEVTLSFGPSSGLTTQVVEGAPVDVLATASEKTMDTVTDAGLTVGPTTFAVNTMAIATPVDPSVPVDGLDDLADPEVKVAVCAQEVPCGVAADALFDKAGLMVSPVTREVDVKAVLAKVTLGEVDAGVVYATDVRAAGDTVVGVAIPDADNVTTTYPISAITTSSDRGTADAFVAFVLSAQGQEVLAGAGFSAP